MKKIVLAGCVILDKEGKLLLIRRNTPTRIQWETPGGKIEDGESPSQAVEREAEEELGVNIEIIKELGRREFKEDEYLLDYIWYLASVKSGTPRIVETDKFDNLAYFTWEELKLRGRKGIKDQLSPNARNLVDAYYSKVISL